MIKGIDHLCLFSFSEVGTSLPEYLSRVQAERKKPQPFILTLGTRLLPSQIFLVIEGVAIEHPTLLKTVDACFKAFLCV